jgi:hypothetical protein
MDVFWFDLARFNNFFNFGDAYFSGLGHIGIEVACRTSEDEVPESVTFPCLDEREVAFQRFF